MLRCQCGELMLVVCWLCVGSAPGSFCIYIKAPVGCTLILSTWDSPERVHKDLLVDCGLFKSYTHIITHNGRHPLPTPHGHLCT